MANSACDMQGYKKETMEEGRIWKYGYPMEEMR